MVEAHHREAVEGQVLDEGAERLLDGVEGLEMVEVLGVDVGDDRDVGRQLEEGAVALVGLDHHPVARAEARIGAVGVDDAAIDDGGSKPPASSRVATSEVVVVLPCVPAMATQCFRRISSASISARRTTGRRALARGHQLRIVALDRRRHHHDLGRAEILRGVADVRPRRPCRAGA